MIRNSHCDGFARPLAILGLLALLAVALFFAFSCRHRSPTPAPAISVPQPLEKEKLAPPVIKFSDVTSIWGIGFSHTNGATSQRLLPETMGSGVALFDYDVDGDDDLLFVNGHTELTRTPGANAPTMALYRNDFPASFVDVTDSVGLTDPLYGMGMAVGDCNADGLPDLYITAVGKNRLYLNRGDHFERPGGGSDADGEADEWSSSAAFFDYDRDGDLDLFVVNYVQWSPDGDAEVGFQLTGIGRAYGPPTAFPGSYSRLYRNDGDCTFTDVSKPAGIEVDNPATGQPMGKGLAVSVADFDGDGWLDLFVANDTVQNFLFQNRGDGSFKEVGTHVGLAFDRNGAATGAMGTDFAEIHEQTTLALAVGNFANEMTSFYESEGNGLPWSDGSIIEGIGHDSRLALTFGLFFFDYDLDGRQDFFQTNGHLEPEIGRVQPSQHYRQSAQLFWNCGSVCRNPFVLADAEQSGDLATPVIGRGAAYSDLDGDGDLDLVITQNGDRPLVLRNDQTLGHHWLAVRVEDSENHTSPIGSRITVTTPRKTQVRWIAPTRSYLSQSSSTATFGLGVEESVLNVEVTWPDGTSQNSSKLKVDQVIVITRQAP